MAQRGPRLVNLALALATAVACLFVLFTPGAQAVKLPAGFEQTTVISGLTRPQDVEIAPNGRVFVAEKTGIIKTWSSLDDTTATVVADLGTQVHNYSGRGLLSLVTHPTFPSQPYVYVYYTMNGPIGSTPPVYGGGTRLFDGCPKVFDAGLGKEIDNCPAGSRVSRLTISGETMTGSEQVLVEDWCQQFASHGGGGLGFGADGNLYVASSDGSTSLFWDYGQKGSPTNPCGDPPGGVGAALTPPTSEGGRLRSQDLRTSGDPTGLTGSLIRINPSTGAPASGNPSGPDTNAKRIIAYGLRDATHIAVRPGTNDVWLSDRGGGYWEEINRVTSASSQRNFGWPCYENVDRRKRSDEQDLNVCEALYASSSTSPAQPHWAYDHELRVHPDESCEQDTAGSPAGSTLSGLAFYPSAGGTFPPIYRNALFFADRLRSCIWVMLPDPATGLPKKGSVIPFLGTDCQASACATRATDLEIAPGGDLLYIDQRSDVVQRIRYTVANQLPTAVATATPASGVMPLDVKFSGLGSTDPDAGDALTYAWDLDGDNLLDDSTAAEPSFTYQNPGTYTVTLQVTDTRGGTALATVTVTVADNGLRTLRFSPVADARVESSNSSRNYGTSSALRTDGSPKIESVLRFDVTGLAGTVQSATLRLTSLSDSTSDGPALYTAAGGWTETGVKWSNRPSFGDTALGDKGAISSNSVVEYDVKSAVTGNGELNLGLRQPGSNSVEFASRENSSSGKRPVLEIVYALPDPEPDPDPDPTPGPAPGPGSGTAPATGATLTATPTAIVPPADVTAPALKLTGSRSQKVLRRRGVVVYASCDSPCTLRASARVSRAGASRSLKMRSIVRKAGTGKQVRLRLRLSKKTLRTVRRSLRRGVKLKAKVTVVATDAAGNSRESSRRVRLKR